MAAPAVLISGAGPTGLMMACQLARFGIPFRIIDKTPDHTTQSRALAVHARSLEIFDQMRMAEEAIEQGEIANGFGVVFNGRQRYFLSLESLPSGLTRFPYVLILEQFKTEALLAAFMEKLGGRIERGVELLSLTQDGKGVDVTLKHPDGSKEITRVGYVVGADGAHSAVREAVGLGFAGKTYPMSLFVLDCRVKSELPPNKIQACFTAFAPFTGLFPMKNGRTRVIGSVPDHVENLSFEDVDRDIEKRTGIKIDLYDPQWLSVYRSHHRYAEHFQVGRCFVTGDAAHIHSPVGGQGMNTGLQDAYNLAWKLALVIQGKAKESLLATYEGERMAIAKTLVHSTDRMFHVLTATGRAGKFLRLVILPLALGLLFRLMRKKVRMRQGFFKVISETGLHYRGGPLAHHASQGHFSKDAPQPGDRAPMICHGYWRDTRFHLIIFTGMGDIGAFDAVSNLAQRYGELIETDALALTNKTKEWYAAFGMEGHGFVLLRPDMYVAYRSASSDAVHFKEYLGRFLTEEKKG